MGSLFRRNRLAGRSPERTLQSLRRQDPSAVELIDFALQVDCWTVIGSGQKSRLKLGFESDRI